MNPWYPSQVDEYGYPYFHHKFGSYGTVSGHIRTVSFNLGLFGYFKYLYWKNEKFFFRNFEDEEFIYTVDVLKDVANIDVHIQVQ